MYKKADVAVVIPLYRDYIEPSERISLNQAEHILREYTIIFVMPEGMAFNEGDKYRKEYFEKEHFVSIKAYNDLLLKTKFYERFAEFQYILIYQLDAFVFEDRLMYFCDLQYDYIGAPWLSGVQEYVDSQHTVWHVGNGGFSLRNVSGCINLLKRRIVSQDCTINEDVYFSSGNSDDFRVAPIKVALEFAFEMEVKKCFELNEGRCPFGCHAWERFDIKFWKPYIEKFGYKIDKKYLSVGNYDAEHEISYMKKVIESFFWKKIFNIQAFEKAMCEIQGKIYIWGAGKRGQLLEKIFRETHIYIEGYLDSKEKLAGHCFGTQKIVSKEEFERNRNGAYVIIALDQYRDEVAVQLEQIGFQYRQNYLFYTDIFKRIADNYFSCLVIEEKI